MAGPDAPKLIARNAAALRRFADPSAGMPSIAGNPVTTRLESGIGNCFPGLECDLRNLERRFFPFLEIDMIGNFMLLIAVDETGVAEARAAGDLSAADAATYGALATLVGNGRTVLVSRIGGTFGPLGAQTFRPALPSFGGAPAVAGDFGTPSTGPGRRPTDAWTAVRLLTEGTEVTLRFANDGSAATQELTAPRARYLDDNGTLAAAFLPGELSQSLCSPWTHDFRDCGCFYWASNHPDIAQPVLPAATEPDQPWNAAVPWQRRDRTIGPQPPLPASEARSTPVELRHYEINNRWQELHFVAGRREIVAPFGQTPETGMPFGDLPTLRANLVYAAGVELAVAQEYLSAAYSLRPDGDPATAGNGELRDDIRATRSELMRIAIGEMRHIRAVNDVLRGFTGAVAFEPALGVASMLPHDPGPFRPTEPRAATRQAVEDFIQIEAQSTGVDGLYNDILATLETPPADVAPLVTDEWRQAIRSIIAEGEDHYETFLNIREWLSIHPETAYLRAPNLAPPPAGLAEDVALQTSYRSLLETLFTGYKKGRFLGADEINAARSAMVAADGIQARAEAVAAAGFLAIFRTPADPRFAPVDPPNLAIA